MHKEGVSLEAMLEGAMPPVLIVSSLVGKGNYSIGEAIKEKDKENKVIAHIIIDEFLPRSAVREDLSRYKLISNHARFLLNLIYRIPFFYSRKLIRERFFKSTNLNTLKEMVVTSGAKTVIGISHRPTFWLSVLKKREKLDFHLYGVLSEFGRNLGWKYIFWDKIDHFISPVDKGQLRLLLPNYVKYTHIALPSREEFRGLASLPGERNKVLFIAGYWGQVCFNHAVKIIRQITSVSSSIHIAVVCGTNSRLADRLNAYFCNSPQVKIYGQVPSIVDLMTECASIITKPGFSTLVEAFTAKRMIFLLKGMPVAEDNNARYAISNFSAKWFSLQTFMQWYGTGKRDSE